MQKEDYNASSILNSLETSFIGRPLYFHSNIDSTNNAAHDLALKGAKEGTAVAADCQTKGKGRFRRRWESPEGVNIYTSIILRPDIHPQTAPKITLMAAVAVAETISKFLNNGSGCKPEPAVKWPNDILLNSKKVAGILTEMNSEMDKINFIVLGMGININMTKDMLPKELRHIATSLKEETGRDISRIDFISTLFLNIEKWYKTFLKDGFTTVHQAWKGYFNMAGKMVKIREMDREIEGIALTIDEDGLLVVREKSGKIVKIVSGDIVIEHY